MMEIFKKNKYIIIGITLLFVGFIIYNNFLKKEESNKIQDVVVAETDKDILDMLNVLDKIKDIEINPDFFNQKPNDKGYILVFSELDPTEPKPNKKIPGKINPFILGGAINYQNYTETNIDTDSVDTEINDTSVIDQTPAVQETILPSNS